MKIGGRRTANASHSVAAATADATIAPLPMTPAAAPLQPPAEARWLASPVLAWFFVTAWGSGYLATKAGLQYAPPFTFLVLRFAVGVLLLAPLALWWHHRGRLRWPSGGREWTHVIVAGLLMHAANLGGSHYAQYLGMSAGVTALVLSVQPLATAAIAAALLHERPRPLQAARGLHRRRPGETLETRLKSWMAEPSNISLDPR